MVNSLLTVEIESISKHLSKCWYVNDLHSKSAGEMMNRSPDVESAIWK